MNEQLTQLTAWYSDAPDDSRPSEEQWRSILERPSDAPITLINFFKLRGLADNGDAGATGQDAFNAYAEVSIPTMERVGGKFLFVGAFGGMFLGAEEDWDVIAIGSYPNLQALIDLYSDANYRKAFVHRTAACERQKVIVGNAMS
ncbi:DUF1330 domain-containing protein [Roseibium porphyridii]|uniref:DUF1330 domain-containing protein n=1 Tax=Roseibium porphyridii TaxID=2866279 RepID=A0ABY8F5T9_9HYPH|nr:DUF1330 domain-containing protein [Roseibium sp. KMA01]WFE89799.1 DUF1330 domain-containing protein [Roseibium sp. KMA01]